MMGSCSPEARRVMRTEDVGGSERSQKGSGALIQGVHDPRSKEQPLNHVRSICHPQHYRRSRGLHVGHPRRPRDSQVPSKHAFAHAACYLCVFGCASASQCPSSRQKKLHTSVCSYQPINVLAGKVHAYRHALDVAVVRGSRLEHTVSLLHLEPGSALGSTSRSSFDICSST